MKRNFSLFALISAITLVSFTGPGLTKNKKLSVTPFNEQSSFEIDGESWNDCTGEWMHLTGQIHFNIHGVINNNRISMVQHSNYQALSGIGLTSGKHYAGSGSFNYIGNGNFSGSYTVLTTSSVRLSASQGGNNLVFTMRVKTTVNANGDVTVSRFDDAMFCQ